MSRLGLMTDALMVALFLPTMLFGVALIGAVTVVAGLEPLRTHDQQYISGLLGFVLLMFLLFIAIGVRAAVFLLRQPHAPPTSLDSSLGPWRRTTTLWWGIFGVTTGILMLVPSLDGVVTDLRYLIDGDTAPATVVRRAEAAHRLAFEMVTPAGQRVEFDVAVSQDEWRSAVPLSARTIEYVRSDPTVHRLPGNQSWLWSLPAMLLGAFLTVGGIRAIALGRTRLHGVRSLLEHGQFADGALTRVSRRPLLRRVPGILNIWGTTLDYSWTDQEGQHHATQEVMIDDPYDLWSEPTGTVLYDPESPEDALWLGQRAGAAAQAA